MASFSKELYIPEQLREQQIYQFCSHFNSRENSLLERCESVLQQCRFNKEINNLARIHPESTPETTLEILTRLQDLRAIISNTVSKPSDARLVKKYQGFAQFLKGYTPEQKIDICYECLGNKSIFLHLQTMEDDCCDPEARNEMIVRIVGRVQNLMTFSELKSYMLERSLTLHDLDDYVKQSLSQRDFRWKVRFGEEFSEAILINRCDDRHTESNWINYSIRNANYLSTFRYGLQPLFGHMMRQSVILGASCLKENKWDVKDILDFFAFSRSTIAHAMNHAPASYLFGRKRSPSKISKSPIVSCYANMAEILFQISDSPYVQCSPEKVHGILKGRKVRFIYDDIILEEVLIIYDASKNQYSGEVTHTSSRYNEKIYTILQKLYEVYYTLHDNEQQLEILGQLFWWICRGKFWSQGETSIAEGTIKAIYLFTTGKELPPWKEEIIPWAEVMVHPDPVLFGRFFISLFDFSYEHKNINDENIVQHFSALS